MAVIKITEQNFEEGEYEPGAEIPRGEHPDPAGI